MEKVLYKKGYLIRITSWENDGDAYRTEEVNVDSEAEAKQIVEFARLFESKSRRGKIGNIYDRAYTEVVGVLSKFYKKYPDFIEKPDDEAEGYKEGEQLVEFMLERASGLGLTGNEFYTRVCQSVEVLYFAEDVICEDLTQKW